jgi:hypothetical protein
VPRRRTADAGACRVTPADVTSGGRRGRGRRLEGAAREDQIVGCDDEADAEADPSCGHWCAGEVVLGVVVVVDGVVVDWVVVVVVVEPLPIAAKAAPPPATSAPHTANTRKNRFIGT